jgi:hypothetical protein
MKHFNFKTIILCCIASVYFVGCGPDPCKPKFNCGANGTCLEGICNCSDGYEGDSCEIASSTKFIGRWKGQEIYYYDSYSDTVAVDWTAQATTKPTELKVTAANGTVSVLKLNVNKLTVQNEIILDNKHTITSGTATINTAKTQINYQFDYKQIGTNSAFYGRGVLVKQ